MTNLTWHLGKAKESLDFWYSEITFWNKLGSEFWYFRKGCKQQALLCKAKGLVWHDRWKMLLDCRRTVIDL
jgi:hypothetical protein